MNTDQRNLIAYYMGMAAAKGIITATELYIGLYRYCENRDLATVADSFGITREEVRKVEIGIAAKVPGIAAVVAAYRADKMTATPPARETIGGIALRIARETTEGRDYV